MIEFARRHPDRVSRLVLVGAHARGSLTRPVGRPSLTEVKRLFEDFEDQAQSWEDERRVVAKIKLHPGKLFPRVGLFVTNLPMEPGWVKKLV